MVTQKNQFLFPGVGRKPILKQSSWLFNLKIIRTLFCLLKAEDSLRLFPSPAFTTSCSLYAQGFLTAGFPGSADKPPLTLLPWLSLSLSNSASSYPLKGLTFRHCKTYPERRSKGGRIQVMLRAAVLLTFLRGYGCRASCNNGWPLPGLQTVTLGELPKSRPNLH